MTKYAYPVIGGPLDGTHATTDELGWSGPEYFAFNANGSVPTTLIPRTETRKAKRVPTHSSMIYVHKSLLQTKVPVKSRG